MHGERSGLTPLWLISLAMVLGTLIVVFIPLAISGGDTIKSNDWIGFAGNIVAGIMTLIAAFVAWSAVQKQIAAQDRIAQVQIDIQRYEIVQRQTEFLVGETHVCGECTSKATYALNILPMLSAPDLSYGTLQVVHTAYEDLHREVENLDIKAGSTGVKRWSFSNGVNARNNLMVALVEFRGEIIKASHEMKQIMIANNQFEAKLEALPVSARDKCRAISVKPSCDALVTLAGVYDEVLRTEIRRLFALTIAARASAGI